jgi:hypothetical protein
VPVLGLPKPVDQDADLGRSADERRQPALHRDVEPGPTPPRPEDFEGLHRRMPLDRHHTEIRCLEETGDGPVRGLAHEHAGRARHLLEPGGEVRRVPDRRVVHPQVVPDAADDDGTRVDPDPHLEGLSDAGLDVATHVPQGALDAKRRMDGATRPVLVGDRRAEESHHPVARVLVHRPLEAVHLGRDHLEAPVDDLVDLLGFEPLGQAREAREVGEEHGHQAALALQAGAGPEDLVGKMLRRVAAGRHAGCDRLGWPVLGGLWRDRRGGGVGIPEALATAAAEPLASLVGEPACGAG